jgi:hypothetical protein
VNSASCFERDEVADMTRESWDRHLEPNLRAPLVLAQGFAEALPVGRCGVIVNLLDERVWNLTPHFISYTVSKSALWTLTRTLALALAPRIRVNGIGPGPTLPSARQSAEQFARQCASVPLGRGTSPDEICQAIQFLLAAGSVTGQMIALDGGQHLGWAQRNERHRPRGGQYGGSGQWIELRPDRALPLAAGKRRPRSPRNASSCATCLCRAASASPRTNAPGVNESASI